MMKYDFDQIIERRDTDSIKWGLYPEDVIPLWVADMDFKSATPVIQALQRRAGHGVFGYSRPAAGLKAAIRERLRGLHQWEVGDEEILFLPGIVSGLNIAIQSFAAPGEGVLVQPPVYFHFMRDPVHHGRMVQDPPLVRAGDTYEIDFDRFEESITDRTRLFILCNPHNPVGRAFTRAELERIAEVCLRHRLILCSDEIHCDLLFPDKRHISIASLSPEIADCTVTLLSPSKTYNLAGLGCGYAIIRNRKLRQEWQKVSFGIVPAVNVMGHAAALAALTEGQEWLNQLMVYLHGNRDFLAGFIRNRLPSITMCRMEATYLAWLDCSHAGIPGNPADFFLKEARLGLSNGADFGKGGEGYVRLNIACPRAILAEAMERLAKAIARL
jgi:cystathionine beta-lyase